MSKLLTGFVAGLIVGILIAPDKGSETRKRLSQRSADLKNKFNDLVDDISEKYDSAKEGAGDLLQRGKGKAQAFRSETGNDWNTQTQS